MAVAGGYFFSQYRTVSLHGGKQTTRHQSFILWAFKDDVGMKLKVGG